MRLRGIADFAVLVIGLVSVGCEDKPAEAPPIAALADLTTRQLIAGLNAKSSKVLAGLIVLTSTTGGPPRPLREAELPLLVYPKGPFEYEGAGKPGLMVLRDGKKEKRAIRLIRVGDAMKVLAVNESFSSYAARESGAAPAIAVDARVVSFVNRD
jgi:hypothetical protein